MIVGKEWTSKGDIFSFGSKHHFRQRNIQKKFIILAIETIEKLERPFKSDPLHHLLKRCQSKNPIERPSSLSILETAQKYVTGHTERSAASLHSLLGNSLGGYHLQALETISLGLDTREPFTSRISKFHREKIIGRLNFLCEDGAEELFCHYGKSLHLAVLLKQKEKLQTLLQDERDPNEQWKLSGWTPLHLATQEGSQAMINILIGAKADRMVKDSAGFIPENYDSGMNLLR